MNYEQAIQYWFGRINYERRPLRLKDLKLERMETLLDLLGQPHHHLPIIHIAGSKGKGSTAAMLAAILQHAGYRTGLFTSPHLSHIEERIRINDVPIASNDIADLMGEVAAAVSVMDKAESDEHARVTFFEIATALGFLHFHRQKVDAAVVEVGLGGRFDSTNVCQPLLSIITSISFDHMQQLGKTLSSIAFEKAGIVKVGRSVLSGVRDVEAQQVIEDICRQRSAPLRSLAQQFDYTYEPGQVTADDIRLPCLQVTTETRTWPVMPLRLLGEHQAANAAVTVAAVEELRQQKYCIDDQAVKAGLAEVRWPARLEIIARQPMIVLDCAHNLASVQALLDTLQVSFPHHVPATKVSDGPTRHLIFAASSDKDVAGMLQLLAPYFDHVWLTCYRNNPRQVPPDQLVPILQRLPSLAYTVDDNVEDVLRTVLAKAQPADLICITGSVFLAGELRPLLHDRQESPYYESEPQP